MYLTSSPPPPRVLTCIPRPPPNHFQTVLCNYVKITGTDENGETVSFARGIWKGQILPEGGCDGYKGIDLYTRWRSAQAMVRSCNTQSENVKIFAHNVYLIYLEYLTSCFHNPCALKLQQSILGCFTGAMAVWPLVCACGKQLDMRTVLNIGSNALWSCLWSGLTLLMLSSDACKAEFLTNVRCNMDTGAHCAISATVLFFVASMSISCSIAVATVIAVAEEENAAPAAAEEEEGKV